MVSNSDLHNVGLQYYACIHSIALLFPPPFTVLFRTVVFQAMRTLEEMRGKGVAKALSAYMKDFVKRELPQVQRLRISAQSHNISSIGIHVKQVPSITQIPR